MKQLLWSVVLLLLITQATSYNILIMMAFASKSHKNAFDPIAEGFAKNGHKVTVFSPIREKEGIPGVDHVYLSNVARILDTSTLNFFLGTAHDLKFLRSMFGLARNICNTTFQGEPAITQLLQDPKGSNYDVIIIDGAMNDFLLPIGHHLGIPIVTVFPANRLPWTSVRTNIPYPPYVNPGLEKYELTFLERVKNTLLTLAFMYTSANYIFADCDQSIKEVLPNSPRILDLEKSQAFLLANSHTSIHGSLPDMPYSAEVGCLHCKPAKPLTKELEKYMQSSGDAGVIYFSFGSITKGSDMPLEMRNKIIKILAKVPQKVLWKYENDIENLPKNIKLTKWAPQQDILGHNKTKLFISHGGGLSTFEAIYHGCPILGFPLSGDQWGNVANAVDKGFAESLDWRIFTAEEFEQLLNSMLTDRKYEETAQKLSELLKDRLQDPVETAMYWIEYVIRHKGAEHLKSGAEHLNFFQYFLVDVIGFILSIICIFAFVVYISIRKCLQIFLMPKKNKLKTN